MTKEDIFQLYGRVLKGDKKARKEFIAVYKEYGYAHHYESNPDKTMLHIMYNHLFRKFKK